MQVRSSDQEIVTISPDAFFQYSLVFKHLAECEQSQEILPLEIESKVLIKLNDFLIKLLSEKPSEIPKPIPSKKLNEFLSTMEVEFIQSLKDDRQTMLKAAHYLNIQHITNLIYVSFAADFIGYTTQEFITQLGLNVQYTPELEQKILEQYKQLLKK